MQTDRREPLQAITVNATQPFNVLVAEPDLGTRDTLAEMLAEVGAAAHLADSGRRALDIARAVPLHAGIIDATMVDMTGLQLLSSLRELVTCPVLFVGAVTASKEIRLRVADAGAWSWLPRPFERDLAQMTIRVFAGLLRNL